jgi:hypothetical protein
MPEDRLLPPPNGTPRHDVVFMGHLGAPGREEMARRLRSRWHFANYGDYSRDQRRIWGREMTAICQNTSIMIGTNWRNDVPGYWSDRIYVVSGAGGFYLGQYVPGLERCFKDGVHCGFFDGFDDMEVKVAWWLAHDKEREACRKRAFELVHSRHTYIHRVGELLDAMKRLRIVK